VTHLYLVRHADSVDGLEDGRYRDLGLSAEGVAQAERLRDRLAATGELRPDVFVASPERRARETAAILAPAVGVPVVEDPDVEEWRSDDGSLSPEVFMERWRNVPAARKPYYRFVEGYENRVEFTLRVQLALDRIAHGHEGRTVLVLTHGAFIQLSFLYFFGYGEASLDRASPEIGKTSITHWYRTGESPRWVLGRSNDLHHLRD
jgi:2,3-bisphosphoglycerate-dependent phosphoglycerate mutase